MFDIFCLRIRKSCNFICCVAHKSEIKIVDNKVYQKILHIKLMFMFPKKYILLGEVHAMENKYLTETRRPISLKDIS